MKCKIKLIIMTVALCLLLSACAGKAVIPQRPAAELLDWDRFPCTRSITMPLYFLTADNSRLAVEMRDIVLQEGESTVQAAMRELLKGPSQPGMRTVLKSVTMESAEVSQGTVNIDLSQEARAGLEYESDTIRARAMIANTLCDLLNVDYINMTIEGMEPGYSNVPLGTMKRLNSDLTLYIEQTTRAIIDNDYPMARNITLYFPDVTGSYLLCETREVQLEDSNFTDVVLKELIKGPRNTADMQSFISQSAAYTAGYPLPAGEDTEITTAESLNAYEKLEISFTENALVDTRLAQAAVVCSLTGFVPRMEGVSVLFSRGGSDAFVLGEDSYKTHADYAGLIGANATLHYPQKDASAIGTSARAIPQALAENPEVLLKELMKSPPEGCKSVFPEGMKPEFLLKAGLSDDIAVVDFSQEFADMCYNMTSDDDIMLMIYSVVDTLTEIANINRVQFLIEGRSIDSFGGIKLVGPLLRNPGLVR